MNRYGKIDAFGDLVIASNTIQNNNEIIVNPTDDEYLANGYKLVLFDDMLPPQEGFNIEKYYEQNETTIYVKYRYIEIIDIDDEIINNEEI